MRRTKKSLVQFPCDFPIKIMGKTDADLLTITKGIFKKVGIKENKILDIQTRLSSDEMYQSLTVVFKAKNQAILDKLYQQLSAHEDIKMVL